MATYRVVNELGAIQAEYPVYSLAYGEVQRLFNMGNQTGHYKIEQIEVVYSTEPEERYGE